MGKIVTSPTNGAAGVIPAVLLYHQYFADNKGFEDVKKFLLVAVEDQFAFHLGVNDYNFLVRGYTAGFFIGKSFILVMGFYLVIPIS